MRRRTIDNDGFAASRARRAAATVVTVLVVAVLASAAGASAGQTDAEREREAVRDRQDQLADQLDVLLASDAEIDAALTELEDRIAGQQRIADEAAASAAAAAAASREADVAWARAVRDVELLEAAIREMAIASYVHPPTADLIQSLQANSLSEALLQKAYLDARADRDLSLLDLLETAETEAARRATAATEAAAEADRAADHADAELSSLRAEQAELATFAADLEERINASLAEAAVLADLDADLSAEIAREQAELIARLPPPPPPPPPPPTTTTTVPPTTAPPATVASDEEVAGDEPDEDEVVDDEGEPVDADESDADDGAQEDDESDDDESDDDESDRPYTEPPPLETVQGITVHADIAADVDAMLTAAAADGIDLSGSGYRSTERQIELRKANCGPTEYDIWERPASQCRPPTAKPGSSLHEQGRAIDMTYNGRLITSRDNPGFLWLREHAADYGLFNLPSEPWHWSTTGG